MRIIKLVYRDILLLVLIVSVSFFTSHISPHIGYELIGDVQYSTFVWPIFCMGIFFFILVLYSLYKNIESYKLSQICDFLNLKKITLNNFLISIGIFLSAIVLTMLVNMLFVHVLNGKFFPPAQMLEGVQRPDNTIKALIVVGLVFGGVFEELFWRGYWIKRQVVRYGKNAWIINAVLWSISHIIAYNPIKIIFIAFSFSFISNRYRTSTITVIFHAMINIFVGLRIITAYS